MLSTYMLLNVYKDAAGLWHEDRFRPLATSLANLALNLVLVQFWGVYGVLLSTVISMLIVGMPWLFFNMFTVFFDKNLAKPYLRQIFYYVIISFVACSISYAHVLAMEQIMSTGGGWQDQVGGITSGLKYITSMPGLQQQLQVAHIELSPQTKKELDERFVLIYTGQRRLARNLLRDVVGRYVGNEPDSLFALEEIQKTAALMRFELERGNVDGFAKLLDYHWELSKKIDAGSSNTLIEQIFSSIEELVDGKLVCGAGGGGFLQVILKKGVTRQMVEERLKEVFMDSLVGVADCKLVWE